MTSPDKISKRDFVLTVSGYFGPLFHLLGQRLDFIFKGADGLTGLYSCCFEDAKKLHPVCIRAV